MLVAVVDMHMLPDPHALLGLPLLKQLDVEHAAAVGRIVGVALVGDLVGFALVGDLVGLAVGLVTGEHVVMLVKLTPL